jgi:fructose-1,6-bisphosphatase/inositol monophosphatase family enzyme
VTIDVASLKRFANSLLAVGEETLHFATQRLSKGEKPNIDEAVEAKIIKLAGEHFPGVPVLAEESYMRQVMDAPKGGNQIIIDPIDGTRQLNAGGDGWSIAVALLQDGVPVGSAVVVPARNVSYYGFKGAGCWRTHDFQKLGWRKHYRDNYPDPRLGLDLARRVVKDDACWEITRRLIKEFGYAVNAPSVRSGLRVMQGNSNLWWTANARVWDIAPVYPLITEMGCVGEYMSGHPINWLEVNQPSVLFADSRKTLDRARKAIGDLCGYTIPPASKQ